MQRWLSWSKAHDWKSCILGIVSRVRIPLSAPTKKAPFMGAFFVGKMQREGFDGRVLAKATVRPLPPPCPRPQPRRIPLSASFCTPTGVLILLYGMEWDSKGAGVNGAPVALQSCAPTKPAGATESLSLRPLISLPPPHPPQAVPLPLKGKAYLYNSGKY